MLKSSFFFISSRSVIVKIRKEKTMKNYFSFSWFKIKNNKFSVSSKNAITLSFNKGFHQNRIEMAWTPTNSKPRVTVNLSWRISLLSYCTWKLGWRYSFYVPLLNRVYHFLSINFGTVFINDRCMFLVSPEKSTSMECVPYDSRRFINIFLGSSKLIFFKVLNKFFFQRQKNIPINYLGTTCSYKIQLG